MGIDDQMVMNRRAGGHGPGRMRERHGAPGCRVFAGRWSFCWTLGFGGVRSVPSGARGVAGRVARWRVRPPLKSAGVPGSVVRGPCFARARGGRVAWPTQTPHGRGVLLPSAARTRRAAFRSPAARCAPALEAQRTKKARPGLRPTPQREHRPVSPDCEREARRPGYSPRNGRTGPPRACSSRDDTRGSRRCFPGFGPWSSGNLAA